MCICVTTKVANTTGVTRYIFMCKKKYILIYLYKTIYMYKYITIYTYILIII
jgi:hypothetical protein